jgi:hypothetical protein
MRSHRRRWFMVLGVMLLATVPAVTQELRPDTTTATPAASWTSFEGAALLAEPIEVLVAESIGQQCEGFELPPQPTLLHAARITDDGELAQLEGLAACVTSGPLNGYELELFGSSELPGKAEYPVESSGPADVVRAVLGRLGVPFETMTVRDLEQSPMGSDHAAARVNVAVRGEAPTSEEAP